MTETGTCGKCGTEYERYLVLVKDDFVAITDFERIKDEYGRVCRDCRRELAHPGGYAMTEQP